MRRNFLRKLRREKNKKQVAQKRALDKEIFEGDKQVYNLLNSMLDHYYMDNLKWEPLEFNQKDIDAPLILSRKERNRIFALNSRVRHKLMRAELKKRVSKLEGLLEPSFFWPLPSIENENVDKITSITIHLGGKVYTSGCFEI